MTTLEAAQQLGVHRSSIIRAIHRGDLTAQKDRWDCWWVDDDAVAAIQRRRDDDDRKQRCEAITTPRRGSRQCQLRGYYDPVEGGFRCDIHEAKGIRS